jgi:nitrogenase molybdenum-iron protein alpha/beta subunit
LKIQLVGSASDLISQSFLRSVDIVVVPSFGRSGSFYTGYDLASGSIAGEVLAG